MNKIKYETKGINEITEKLIQEFKKVNNTQKIK